ncbi:Hydroxysteroid 17-beta dehydrogenase 6, partial [Heterocephalus glaber]
RQGVSHLQDKYVFITGCDSGFGNLLARQLDMRGLRVLAACLTEKGAEQLRKQTSEWLETVILDITQTESIAAATEWVKEHVGHRDSLFNKWCWKNWVSTCQRLKLDLYLSPCTKLKLKWIKDLSIQTETLSWLEQSNSPAQGFIVMMGSLLVSLPRGLVCLNICGYSLSKYLCVCFLLFVSLLCVPFCLHLQLISSRFLTPKLASMVQDVCAQCQTCTQVNAKKMLGGNGTQCQDYSIVKQGLSNCSTNLNLVSDCMEHALIPVQPHPLYSGGWHDQFFFIPLSYLPTSLADYILTRSHPKPAQ